MSPSSIVQTLGWTPQSVAETFTRAMEDYRRELGERIRRLREARELTQEDLADLVGVRSKTISRWENGRNEALRDNARTLAKALGVSEETILGTPPAPFGLGAGNDGPTQLDRIEAKLDRVLALLGVNPLDEDDLHPAPGDELAPPGEDDEPTEQAGRGLG